jgi:hypothetical protein
MVRNEMFFKSENEKTTNIRQKVTLKRIKQLQKETGNELGFFLFVLSREENTAVILCAAQK